MSVSESRKFRFEKSLNCQHKIQIENEQKNNQSGFFSFYILVHMIMFPCSYDHVFKKIFLLPFLFLPLNVYLFKNNF